jgi:hypothetical protein
MLFRLIMATGAFAAGYYLGREVGRHETFQRELDEGRAAGASEEVFAGGRGVKEHPNPSSSGDPG